MNPDLVVVKTEAEILIQGQGINQTWGERHVLQNIDLAICENEIVTIIGPNGCGKSSLLRILLGLNIPDSGKVTRRKGLRIGYMPQKLRIDDRLPLSVTGFLMLAPGARKVRVKEWLERLSITSLAEQAVQRLSGGEWQRVLLARALLIEPHLLVLDEPVQGVDIQGQRELYQLLPELRNELGCGIVLVSHDLHLVMASTDRVICLNGHICCSGHPDQVSVSDEYNSLFGHNGGHQPVLEAVAEITPELAHYTHHHDHTHCVDGHVEGSSECIEKEHKHD
ncbi:MAG: ATP-binding cassette domain-containing protein [Oleispira sp.]|nr:ATP-binding cassette domain-containing protein [Oleispira sp.]MBL4880877.1 ATP-binding cassette domain-containing protein [Oleispira sp.]